MLPPAAQPLTEQLRSIASATVAVVNLEYEGFVLPVTVRPYSVISNNNVEDTIVTGYLSKWALLIKLCTAWSDCCSYIFIIQRFCLHYREHSFFLHDLFINVFAMCLRALDTWCRPQKTLVC